MKELIIEESEMPVEIDTSIRKGLCECFTPDAVFFAESRAWHGSSPAFTAVFLDGNAVVAHVGVVDRTISIDGRFLRVAGVQNVFVLPSQRGKQLCGQVMAAAMRESVRRGFDCGLLFCIPELEKVYTGAGWQGLGPRNAIRTENGRDIPIPDKNIAMYYPLSLRDFPTGGIRLQGNDW